MKRQGERAWASHYADGRRLFLEGHDAEAERELQRALHQAEAARLDGSRLACTHFQLARLAQADHRWSDADQHYQQALADEEAALGADHPYVAMILRAHAGLLRRLRREAEAAELERRAEALWGDESPRRPVGMVA
jgi:hypothetical protein